MGRAKMKMELIRKEKARSLAFKKRKGGLLKKLHELTTLCDVSACMIIYENGAVLPELWPKNTNEVKRIIGVYKSKDCAAGNKTFGLSDFFHNRAKKAEEELAKIKKKNMEAKYPTRSEWLTELGEPQLRDFSALLANKAAHVKSIIQILRTNQITTTTFGNPNFHHHQMLMQQQFLPKIDHHSQYSMFLMNQNHQFQPAASSSTYNIQLPSSSFSNIAGGSWPLDPMISHSLAAGYYAPPPPPCNMQTQVKWENEDDVGQDDIDQFFINNYSAC